MTSCISRAPDASDSDSWRMQARVAIKTQNKAASFGIKWHQEPDSFDLRLSGVLGIPVAHIYGDETRVVIEIPKEGSFEADSASNLLKQYTGLILPIESMRYWVRGNPAPDIPYQYFDKTLHQSGWQIDYLRYEGDDPVKMRLTRPELNILLVVKSWR